MTRRNNVQHIYACMSEAYINLSALRRNAEKCSAFSKLCAVVKANGYGLGAVKVAEAVYDIADMFAVATPDEADELVAWGIEKDILILGKSHKTCRAKNVIYTVSSEDDINAVCSTKRRLAIKVNTGMNRYGAEPDRVQRLMRYAARKGEITSVYTHLRDSSNEALSRQQLSLFKEATEGINLPKHIAATGGISLGKDFALGLVRCGIGLYGGADGFEWVVNITAPVLDVRSVGMGEGVGYGSEVFESETRIAVIGIGYADGYRRLSTPRYVFINGERCRVISVCMDVCFAAVQEAQRGDIAEILGEHIGIDELARSYGTITYEVLTGWGKRVIRRYGKERNQTTL